MSIYRRFPEQDDPSFITTNTYERRRLFLNHSSCKLFMSIMLAAITETRATLLAFAVMPDHVHLIIHPTATPISRTMQLIKGRFSREYNRRRQTSGTLWQNRFHDRILSTEAALASAIEYVHNNPVVAGLAARPEDYPYSSADGRCHAALEEFLGGDSQAEA